MFNEEKMIYSLKSQCSPHSSTVVGIGDDAAIIPFNKAESYVITKDLLVEDKHFSLKYFNPESLAYKALHVNLSDIAAMGAESKFALLGLAIPSTVSSDFVDRFLNAFTENCKRHSIHLIGGDTTASSAKLFISLTVIGKGANEHLKFRHMAEAGDIICIAGDIGQAHAGLVALERGVSGVENLKVKALRPTARVKEGAWFGARAEITAMMDISDGLYVDLKRLCSSSKVGGEIFLQNLKPSLELSKVCSVLQIDTLECMLIGGEDYGLLVTIKPEFFKDVIEAFEQSFGYKLIKVGQITSSGSLKVINENTEIPFTYQPFSHFAEHNVS